MSGSPTITGPPIALFHYTNLSGVCGIATNKCIWATSIRHLNDSTEFTYAHTVLKQVLEHSTRGVPAQVVAAVEFMLSYLDLTKMSAEVNAMGRFGATYVVSLSSEPDKLSQWRAYSLGGGYSLGFRTEALLAIARHQGFSLVQCSYDRDIHLREAQAIANDLLARIDALPRNILEVIEPGGAHSPRAIQSWLFPIRQAMTEEIQRHASKWKHPSFQEEAEWRLVSAQRLDREVRFRAGRTAIIPYVEVRLTEPQETQISNMTAVLCNTYVGPCAEPEIAVGTLQHLFDVQRISCPQYTLSGIPFRNW